MSSLETRLSAKLEGVQLREAVGRMAALPRYATEWERRIVALGPDHEAIDVAIAKLRTMRNPRSCPEEWLFLLAWDLSVDVWEAEWPVHIKRRVCEASWIVHRFKGTRYAIEEGLKALGMTVELKRWFDFDPPKHAGTFSARVFASEEIFGQQDGFSFTKSKSAAFQSIWRNKPLTRHFSFEFGVVTRVAGYVGTHAMTGARYVAALPAHDAQADDTLLYPASLSLAGGKFQAGMDI